MRPRSTPSRAWARASVWLLGATLARSATAADPGASPGPAVASPPGSLPESDAARAASADALVEEAIQLRREGNDAAALDRLERARVLAPGSTRVRVHLASVHQALGNWAAAETLLGEVLA